MISDLDETIKQLLIQKGTFDPVEVDIRFEAPDQEWSASISKPTINIYLYDIRENHQLRSYEWAVERNEDRTATGKRLPLRGDFSYLVTVWASHVEDEHALLGRLLVVLSRYPILPEDVLHGELQRMEYPIHAAAAQPDGLFKSPADFWSAMDNRIKPSINYVVTMPVDLEIALTVPIVFTKIIQVEELEAG